MEAARLVVQRWALAELRALAARRSGTKARPAHLVTGEQGEFEAVFFLRRQGFHVVERRWRTPELQGDLDLIAWEGETLCFIEVKTRRKRDLTPAATAIDRGKRRMLRRMGEAYRRTLPGGQRFRCAVRFDVVSVYLLGAEDGQVQCELVRGAFTEEEDYFRRAGV